LGTGRRFDSIWLTAHWIVDHTSHLYDEAIAAGSDHALVIADLAAARPTPNPRKTSSNRYACMRSVVLTTRGTSDQATRAAVGTDAHA
jgi:hypothetical protein